MSDCATCGQPVGDSTHVCRGLDVTCMSCGQPVGDATHLCAGPQPSYIFFATGMQGGKTQAMREFLRRHPGSRVIRPGSKP